MQPRPHFDIDGSGDELGAHAVTATDALLVLRKSVGLPLPVHLLDAQQFRREMARWLLNHQNGLGLIEFAPGPLRLAATYDQGVSGIALLAQYQAMLVGFVFEQAFTKEALVAAVQAIVQFYVEKYEQAENAGGFRGFAEFYHPDSGQPDYSIGAGGNLAGPSAYIMALAAQFIGLTVNITGGAFGVRVLDMAENIADWLATLERPDGGVRFGTVQGGSQQFAFVSTEHNLSVREALVTHAVLLEEIGDFDTRDRLYEQIIRVNAFLETVVWNDALNAFVAGIDQSGAVDPRRFADLFALAGMSQIALPGGFDEKTFLLQTDPLLRNTHPSDLNPTVTVDGFGSLDRSGIQNEWTMQISFAHNMLDSGPFLTQKPNLWRWAYLVRQIAKARIDEPDGSGSGLAQAAKAHDSGFGGFVWDSQSIAPASVAWWILNTLDFHPFITGREGLVVYLAARHDEGGQAQDDFLLERDRRCMTER